MAIFSTTEGRQVEHCHVVSGNPCHLVSLTDKDREAANDWMRRNFPDAIIIRPATYAYNCYGFALAESHGFMLSAVEFFEDDFHEVPMDQPQLDDVVVYYLDGIVAHVAVVIEVDDDEITLVQSKWGVMPEVQHQLDNVDPVYGEAMVLLRRN